MHHKLKKGEKEIILFYVIKKVFYIDLIKESGEHIILPINEKNNPTRIFISFYKEECTCIASVN
jgi:hypothetical protein